jgi:hypothetical protein
MADSAGASVAEGVSKYGVGTSMGVARPTALHAARAMDAATATATDR